MPTSSKSASAEESAQRGVLARAFLNLCRAHPPNDGVHVGVVLDSQTDARWAILYLEALSYSLGNVPSRLRRTNGNEEFELEPGRRIAFFNRRTGARSIRGWSLDVLYVPSDWPTEDRLESVLPALSSRDGELEFY